MSLINKNNYEAFLLDYMEQNLSADMVAELMLFFEQNPELKHELEELDDMVLPSEAIVFDGKDELKKDVLENLMIAEIEGLNTSTESNELEEAIKEDRENEKAFLLYQKAILKPVAVVFENKESLKRERKIIPLYWWTTSAAAILIAFFLVKNLNTEGVQETQDNFADNKEVEVNTIENEKDSSAGGQPIFIEKLLDNNTIQVAEEKKSTPVKVKEKRVIPIINNEPEIENNNLVAEETPIIEKDSITIMPTIYEDEVLLAENNTTTKKQNPLSVGQFLKKEAQEKVLKEENPEPNKKTEIMVVDLLAKVAGKNARVDKTKNEEDEVEQYALNIGGFSFSKKVRK
tara:strand:+ start:114 stop:1148 length:1035 start_codon:yes stop_codon:yes gene_type:complete